MTDGKKPAAPQAGAEPMVRREFIKRSGVALATTAGAGIATAGAPRRARAAGATEITFASAKFFGKETIAQVVDTYNQSQSKIHVNYVELPPPSSSTEVHQSLVQQLARRSGTPDVFTQDIIWIAEFAAAGWALLAGRRTSITDAQQGLFPGHRRGLHLERQADGAALVSRFGHALLQQAISSAMRHAAPETWERAGRDLAEAARRTAKPGSAFSGRASRPRSWSAISSRSSPRTAAGSSAPDGKTVDHGRACRGRGRAVHARHDHQVQDQPAGRAELGRGAVAAPLHRRPGGLPAQLVLCLVDRAGQGRVQASSARSAWRRCRISRAARAPPASAAISTA